MLTHKYHILQKMYSLLLITPSTTTRQMCFFATIAFVKIWEEMAANEDVVPIEGYNAIISIQSAYDFKELKVTF